MYLKHQTQSRMGQRIIQDYVENTDNEEAEDNQQDPPGEGNDL